MDGTGGHHLKQSWPGLKGQKLHVFSYMQNIGPVQMQATLCIHRNKYSTRI
jgi:hypothetical protein